MASGPGRAVRAVAVGLVALAVVGAGCTDGGGSDGPATSGPAGTAEDAGALRLGIGGDLVVDPVEASLASPRDLMVIDLLADGLTSVDGEGQAVPALAEAWEANDSHTAFRFRLAPDATFASGEAITAEQVIASLERVLAAGDTSLAALSLEALVGFREFVAGEADHISGLTAPGERTVRFALTGPLAVLPVVLSNPLLSVVDVDTVEGDLSELDTTGDWAVAEASGGSLTLRRREGRAGSLGEIELRTYDDEDAAYEAFDGGEVDWAMVPTTRYGDAVNDHGDDAFAPFQAELFFGMNVRSPALGNGFLRLAVQQAIDRDAIVRAVYPDLADPLPTVVPAGVAGHDPDRCPACAHDPEAAEALVDDVFGDDVPTVHIDFDESDAQEAMARVIAANLDDVGIPTELRPLPLDEYKRFVVSGEQELFSFGWIGAYRSPDAYLAPLFGSSANDNLTGFRSAEVDGLLQRARAGESPERNPERWAKAEAQVLQAAVVVPIAQFRTQVVVSDRVQGLQHAVDGTVDWAEVTVSG